MKKNILIVIVAATISACNTSPGKKAEDKQSCSSDERNKSGCGPVNDKKNALASYDFDETHKACQTSSCAVSNYKETDVVSMAEAKTGDITQCPVSGAIFKVKEVSPVFTHDDKTFHTCCSSCATRFKEDPDRFTKNVSLNMRTN